MVLDTVRVQPSTMAGVSYSHPDEQFTLGVKLGLGDKRVHLLRTTYTEKVQVTEEEVRKCVELRLLDGFCTR